MRCIRVEASSYCSRCPHLECVYVYYARFIQLARGKNQNGITRRSMSEPSSLVRRTINSLPRNTFSAHVERGKLD